MTSSARLFLSFLVVAALTACAAKPPEPMPESVPKAWVDAFNGRKAQAMMSLYTSDCVVMPPDAATVQGREAVLDFFMPLLKNGFTLTTVNAEAETRADVAYRRGTYELKDRHGEVTETGKYMEIWRKTQDGKWQMSRDIWNRDSRAAVKPPVMM